jgi:hypothetical protein
MTSVATKGQPSAAARTCRVPTDDRHYNSRRLRLTSRATPIATGRLVEITTYKYLKWRSQKNARNTVQGTIGLRGRRFRCRSTDDRKAADEPKVWPASFRADRLPDVKKGGINSARELPLVGDESLNRLTWCANAEWVTQQARSRTRRQLPGSSLPRRF